MESKVIATTTTGKRELHLVLTDYYGETQVTIRHNPDTVLVMDQHVGKLSHPSTLIDDALHVFGLTRADVQLLATT